MAQRLSKPDKVDAALVGTGCGCIGLVVLVKLAFLALVAWGIFELVTWVVSK